MVPDVRPTTVDRLRTEAQLVADVEPGGPVDEDLVRPADRTALDDGVDGHRRLQVARLAADDDDLVTAGVVGGRERAAGDDHAAGTVAELADELDRQRAARRERAARPGGEHPLVGADRLGGLVGLAVELVDETRHQEQQGHHDGGKEDDDEHAEAPVLQVAQGQQPHGQPPPAARNASIRGFAAS